MERKRLRLKEYYFDNSRDYNISIPGLSNDISLVEKCWCVNNEYDLEEDIEYVTTIADCNHCHGSGLCLTDNGKAILDFIKKYGE